MVGTLVLCRCVLVTPWILFYATGGLAYGQLNSSETISDSPFSVSDTHVGYTRRQEARR
jgi:outer membrane immunogenic protein